MPVAVAVALRYIIMAAVQLGLWGLLEKYGIPLINGAIEAVMVTFGVPKETAQDIMANSVLKAFEDVGIFAATLRTKLPLKVADTLGFSTKGWSLRKLSPTLEAKVGTGAIPSTASAVATQAEVAHVASSVSKLRGLNSIGVLSLLTIVMGVVSLTSNLVLAAANVMDFGNWQGAYQKTFQKIFTALGFPPDSPIPKARTISAGTWTKIYATVEELNPQTIAFPWEDTVKPYSRENLSAAVDHFAANISASGHQATFKNVFGLLLPCIKIQPTGGTTAAAASTTAAAVGSTSIPSVKVFTGVLSQGTLGAGLKFQARPDDLIESAEELRAAATNNLAATLAALPSSLVYELKIVASVTSKDGFTQRGTAQQIVSGHHADGSPKYKTVINKFAVLSVYLVTEKGTRTKIRSVTLGPTDVVKFNPSAGQLGSIESAVKGSIVTSDVSEIQKIVTQSPLAVASVSNSAGTTVTPDAHATVYTEVTNYKDSGYRFYSFPFAGRTEYEVIPWLGNIPFEHTPVTREEMIAGLRAKKLDGYYTDITPFQKLANDIESGKYDGGSGYTFINGIPYTIASAQEADRNRELAAQGYLKEIKVGNGVGYIPTGKTSTSTVATSKVCAATSLYELSVALGESLPTVAQRAPEYERLGLGQAAFYTGTAEQNTKLLLSLQRERGCSM